MSRSAGQIVKRGPNKYLLRIYTGCVNGKRRYTNKTVKGSKKDAQKVLTAMLRDRDMGLLVEPSSLTLSEHISEWLEKTMTGSVIGRTIDDYTGLKERYIDKSLGETPLNQLSTVDIQGFYSSLLARGLSPKVVHHCHTVLSGSLKTAVLWKRLHHNPAKGATLPKDPGGDYKAMTREQANSFLQAARLDHHFPVMALLLLTGLRPSEAAGLKWSDLDLRSTLPTLKVERSVRRPKGGGWHFGGLKTKRSRRSLGLPEGLRTILLEHFANRIPNPHDLVFCTADGEPLEINNFNNRNYKRTLKRAGLGEMVELPGKRGRVQHKFKAWFRLYDLRHTYATMLLLEGVSIKTVSENMGHASVAFTLDRYGHVLPEMKHDASHRLNDAFFPAKPQAAYEGVN